LALVGSVCGAFSFDSKIRLKSQLLMTLPAATRLYRDLHLQQWSHDVEVLFRAKLYAIPIREVLIEWNDKDGSKVVESGVVRVSIEMLLDVLRLRWEYSVTGNWKPADK
jgi:hypothetical protein